MGFFRIMIGIFFSKAVEHFSQQVLSVRNFSHQRLNEKVLNLFEVLMQYRGLFPDNPFEFLVTEGALFPMVLVPHSPS